MKTFGWNCRGICNASTVRALKAQIKGSKPDILFLCETKASKDRMEQVMHSLSFSNLVVVDAKGIARGLYLMWNASSHVELVDFNKNTIVVKICDTICDWHLVGFLWPTIC